MSRIVNLWSEMRCVIRMRPTQVNSGRSASFARRLYA